MEKILFITSNKGKFEWAKRRLKTFGVELVQKQLEIEEPRHIEVEEIALHKAKKASELASYSLIAEDSGFYIASLNKFPATNIKFVLSTIGVEGILKLMEGKKNGDVTFKSALVFMDKKKKTTKTFICNDEGILSDSAKGDNLRGFGDLMKIFIPNGFDKTLAEMSDEEFEKYEKNIEKKDHYFQFGEWMREEIRIRGEDSIKNLL